MIGGEEAFKHYSGHARMSRMYVCVDQNAAQLTYLDHTLILYTFQPGILRCAPCNVYNLFAHPHSLLSILPCVIASVALSHLFNLPILIHSSRSFLLQLIAPHSALEIVFEFMRIVVC